MALDRIRYFHYSEPSSLATCALGRSFTLTKEFSREVPRRPSRFRGRLLRLCPRADRPPPVPSGRRPVLRPQQGPAVPPQRRLQRLHQQPAVVHAASGVGLPRARPGRALRAHQQRRRPPAARLGRRRPPRRGHRDRRHLGGRLDDAHRPPEPAVGRGSSHRRGCLLQRPRRLRPTREMGVASCRCVQLRGIGTGCRHAGALRSHWGRRELRRRRQRDLPMRRRGDASVLHRPFQHLGGRHLPPRNSGL